MLVSIIYLKLLHELFPDSFKINNLRLALALFHKTSIKSLKSDLKILYALVAFMGIPDCRSYVEIVLKTLDSIVIVRIVHFPRKVFAHISCLPFGYKYKKISFASVISW